MILGLTPLFFSIWMDNPPPTGPGVAIARSLPLCTGGLETHPVEGHRDVHILRYHPHYGAPVWVLDAWLPAVGLQGAV